MKVDEAYNQWSTVYDINENRTRDLELKVGKTILSKKEFDNILELGCGTGKNSEWLIDKCNSLTCVDFSTEMIAIAKSKIKSDKVKFISADLTKDWKFINTTFELVTFSLVLEHIDNLDFIFEQSKKHLSKNGLLYICELHPFKQYSGSKARFENQGEVIKLETYIHHISDYLNSANKYGLKLVDFQEWFDDDNKGLPRLASFVLKK